jgi:hypothetical protein
MSYEKVKSIKIDLKEQKVFINCASNNVRPLTFYREEYPYFTNLLKEKGKQEVEIALLRNYEEGNLQGGTNKYTQALKRLYYLFSEEYKRFNWRTQSKYGTAEREQEENLRKSQEFKDLLLKALNSKNPSEKFIIKNVFNGGYVYKITPRFIKFCNHKEQAKIFDFEEEARDSIYKKEGYEIQKVDVITTIKESEENENAI